MTNKKLNKAGEGEGQCNQINCWRQAKRQNGVKFGKNYYYFCDEHVGDALEAAA